MEGGVRGSENRKTAQKYAKKPQTASDFFPNTETAPQRGYSGFQVTGMIEGFFWVCNFRFRDFFVYENLAKVA